jgi:GT2 family glycosyltransferase
MRQINKVSIITLTYKNWRLLDSAINSVKLQIIEKKYEVEYFIVDDGTEDFDQTQVQNNLINFPYKNDIFINHKNIGTVKSFNNAILRTSGELIIPLSADDEFYDGNVVSDIITYFENTNHLIITGIRIPITLGKELEGFPLIRDRHFFSDKGALLNRIALKGNIISGASTYYHREIFDRIGLFDESYHLLEDFPFYLKALKNDIDIGLFKRRTIRCGMQGISSNGVVNLMLNNDFIKAQQSILESDVLGFFGKCYLYIRLCKRKLRSSELFINS